MRLRFLQLQAVECLARPINLSRLAMLIDLITASNRCRCRSGAACAEADQQQNLVSIDGFVFTSPLMRQLIDQVKRVAPLDTTILFTGESGTGKTLLARLLHRWSPRSRRPFVTVQCGALSPTLIESALFGHVRGAFTGADRDQVGKLAEAKGGTVLLDEVDCMPLESQATLLNVVEDRVFEPVGSTRSQSLDARLVVATNRALEGEVAAGRFRPDLYHRLNVVSFALPPLREQRESIRPLARRFLAQYSSEIGKHRHELTDRAIQALEAYHWPGNVRELRNTIERAVALCTGDAIDIDELAPPIRAAGAAVESAPQPVSLACSNQLAQARVTAEVQQLRQALHRHNNNRTRAAAELGVSRMTLFKKLRHYGLG
jgi:DNA-binding NtrC family response regulator